MTPVGGLYIHVSDSNPSVEETIDIDIRPIGYETKPITQGVNYKNFIWKSSDSNILEINVTTSTMQNPVTKEFEKIQKVQATAKYAGTATITVNYEDWTSGKYELKTLQTKVEVKGTSVYNYNSIPNSDATVQKIYEFAYSNAVNAIDGTKEETDYFQFVGLERLEKWKGTVEKYLEENKGDPKEELYKAIIERIELAIKEEKGEDTTGQSSYDIYHKILKDYEKTYGTSILNKLQGVARDEKPFNDVLDNIDYYRPIESTEGQDEVIGKASTILSVITSLGMVIAVLMSAILGIKYMLGSVEEKADYKKGLIPYFVGAILLFGICTIVKTMQQFGGSINNI